MRHASTLLAWLGLALVAALAMLNWTTLMAPAPLDLLVAQVQAPLGVVVLGLAGALVALFFVAYLRSQITSLLETRRLLKEVQRVQDLADKAEASRVAQLQQLMTEEFSRLNQRLNAVVAPTQPATSDESAARGDNEEFRPASLTEIVSGRARA